LPPDYLEVSEEEEAAIVATALSPANSGIIQLFRVYAITDPLRFLWFSRAIAKRHNRAE